MKIFIGWFALFFAVWATGNMRVEDGLSSEVIVFTVGLLIFIFIILVPFFRSREGNEIVNYDPKNVAGGEDTGFYPHKRRYDR